ncbi:MAG TPA: Gfo/Idh/MocA family oxidoreductase [Methylomirabilota bacterium]|nr:Gfo/Idh/MocA family oxidoreductase [Methylomirabilota bacterium]
MLRGAIIGLGNVAVEVHAPAWGRCADVQIVAVSDTAPARRAMAEARLPEARWYAEGEELLAREPLDFVDICTPPGSHAALIAAALARGLHVLCEKPLVVTSEDLARVTALAERHRRAVHTVHNWHHAPIIARTAELVRQGRIGRVTRVMWQTLRVQPAATSNGGGTNWRLDPRLAGGGVLTDHGWHVFYLLGDWIAGLPTAVTARLEQRRHTAAPVEDTATVTVTFPDATAEIFLTWAADRRQNVLELVGTTGRIAVHGDTVLLQGDGTQEQWSCPPPLENGSVHPDWFDPELAAFLRAATGRTTRAANLREAWLCGTLETAARESSRGGGVAVALPKLPPPLG